MDVAAGEIVCLLGRNGAGKTTCMKAIMGLLPLMAGRVMLDGQEISRLPAHEVPKAGIGYVPQGRRLFAGLSVAQKAGQLRRNFQGYTDDRSQVLIGVGASSISRFPQGYAQNAPATSAHTARIRDGEFSTVRGHVFGGEDALRARLIEALMCDFRTDSGEIRKAFDVSRETLNAMYSKANRDFDGLLQITEDGIYIPKPVRPLTRMIARSFDAYEMSEAGHSPAI